MAETTAKLERWRLRLSEFEFYIVQRLGRKLQEADALPLLQARSENKTLLDDEMPVFTRSQAFSAFVPQTKTADLKFLRKRSDLVVLLIPVVCKTAGFTDNEKAKIPTFAGFITAQSSDTNCRTAFTSVKNPNT